MSLVDPKGLSAFLACRLIALDKCSGVRPIGICECARRIISKAILIVTKGDVQEVAGSLQLCAGQIAGIESTVHFMSDCFQSEDIETVLLVDASNAVNFLNRDAALHNIRHICPLLAMVLNNTYTWKLWSCLLMTQHSSLRKEQPRVNLWQCQCMR